MVIAENSTKIAAPISSIFSIVFTDESISSNVTSVTAEQINEIRVNHPALFDTFFPMTTSSMLGSV